MGPERLHLQRCIDQPMARASVATPACSHRETPAQPSHQVHPGPASSDELISLEAEVPEVLLDGMREYLARHPQMDQMQLISSALASFLFQNGAQDRLVAQHYLDALFKQV